MSCSTVFTPITHTFQLKAWFPPNQNIPGWLMSGGCTGALDAGASSSAAEGHGAAGAEQKLS